jgi:hypothetical protein
MATKKTKRAQKTSYGFLLDSNGRFNGKPMAHWDAQADELLIRCLLDAANLDTRSIVGAKTAERIISLAMAIDPVTVRKLMADREAWQHNAGVALNSMIGK